MVDTYIRPALPESILLLRASALSIPVPGFREEKPYDVPGIPNSEFHYSLSVLTLEQSIERSALTFAHHE